MTDLTPMGPRPGRREWLHRLDRIARDLNGVLLVFAIGLATLDATVLATQHVIERLPPIQRVVYVDVPGTAGGVAQVTRVP